MPRRSKRLLRSSQRFLVQLEDPVQPQTKKRKTVPEEEASGEETLIPVLPDEAEFDAVIQKLTSLRCKYPKECKVSRGRPTAQNASPQVYRVNNASLHERFQSASAAPGSESLAVMSTLHGTPGRNVPSICAEGLSMSKSTSGGIWSSTDWNVSVAYALKDDTHFNLCTKAHSPVLSTHNYCNYRHRLSLFLCSILTQQAADSVYFQVHCNEHIRPEYLIYVKRSPGQLYSAT